MFLKQAKDNKLMPGILKELQINNKKIAQV